MSFQALKAISFLKRRFWRLAVLLVLVIALAAAFVNRDQPDRQFQDALAAYQSGDLKTVSRAVKSLEPQPGKKDQVRLLRAAQLQAAGKPAEALEQLTAIRMDRELREPTLLLCSESLLRLGRFAEAEVICRTLVLEKPDLSLAHRRLAMIYHEIGAMHASLAELDQVARLEPDDFFAFRLMALIQFQDFHQYAKAIPLYRKALALDPTPEQRKAILRELAQTLLEQRDYKGALDALQDAPDDALVLALRSDCFWSQGEGERARPLLERALELDPDEHTALMLKARIHLEEGQAQAAIPVLKRLLDRDPHDVQARYQLVLAYRRLGNRETVNAELEKMNDSKRMRMELTKLYEEATRKPQDADVRDKIVELCRQLDKPELAEIWRRAADSSRQARPGS